MIELFEKRDLAEACSSTEDYTQQGECRGKSSNMSQRQRGTDPRQVDTERKKNGINVNCICGIFYGY